MFSLPLTVLRLVRGAGSGDEGWLAWRLGVRTGSGLVRPLRRVARRRLRTGWPIRAGGELSRRQVGQGPVAVVGEELLDDSVAAVLF
ncbi:MAG TPA: hypothetical protein VFD73_13720, partial [Gemmatimonadales bacterium]|nr:hypothetical protein [Gemmatimonadales bacterium]